MSQPPARNLDGSGLAIAVVVARFNDHITGRQLDAALAAAEKHGVPEPAVFWAPGSFELPVIALKLADTGHYDAIVCLGAVVQHETDHHIHVATQAAAGLRQASIETGVPCIFGVLTTHNDEQAVARIDRAADVMEAAIETANLLRAIS